ncbi:MAG: hypothetical protein ACRESO_00720 [Gammaproteobacteria bacterium]
MDSDTHAFCTMIRARSDENRRAMYCFTNLHVVLSPAFSILRQELDSMIRVIYLLQIADQNERLRLIKSTLNGKKWKVPTSKGKQRDVTDREMVDFAQQLQGWTLSVYKFGCAFVHLSDFHNHLALDPFQKLLETERHDVLSHMRNYHGGPEHDHPSMVEISGYLPRVFDKIADNLRCYVEHLEHGDSSCTWCPTRRSS